MSGASGRASLSQPPSTKTIVVYRNGDAFYPGQKIVVNQRQLLTFDSFLSSVTRGVKAPFGAVRNLYTPREGHKVCDMEQLQHGERYVAAGAERFKKLDYFQIATKKPQKKKNDTIQPVVHSSIVTPARWRNVVNESCTITVFTNGEILVPPVRILIPKYTLTKWENVLAMVTEKVSLRTGAVQRLCTLDGTPLLGSDDLENFQYYVAVGTEKFRVLPYFQWIPYNRNSRDGNNGGNRDFPPSTRKYNYVKDMISDRRGASLAEEQEQRGDSLFYARPERVRQKKQVSKIPHLVSGEGGVFKAKDKRKEAVGATEVLEDSRMKADLPIDQTEAEVVSEEQVHSTTPQEQLDKDDTRKTPSGDSETESDSTPTGPVGASGDPGSPRTGRVEPVTEAQHQAETKSDQVEIWSPSN